MGKKYLYLLIILGLVIVASIIYLATTKKQVAAPADVSETSVSESTTTAAPSFVGNEDALKNALNLYIQKKKEGVDMTNGPCLGKVAEDWVLDIAHNPRTSADDEKENQCPDIVNGGVKHFIELDPDGMLIRAI